MKKNALFLDRDGVINHLILQKNIKPFKYDSPQNTEQVKIIDEIIPIIKYANENGICIIEVTNQPGYAKGKMTIENLNAIEDKIHEELAIRGVSIDYIFVCYHHPNAVVKELAMDCNCRKPKPGMLIEASKSLNIDLETSFLLGDNHIDIEAAKSVNMHSLLYIHKENLEEKLKKNHSYECEKCNNLDDALKIIKKHFND